MTFGGAFGGFGSKATGMQGASSPFGSAGSRPATGMRAPHSPWEAFRPGALGGGGAFGGGAKPARPAAGNGYGPHGFPWGGGGWGAHLAGLWNRKPAKKPAKKPAQPTPAAAAPAQQPVTQPTPAPAAPVQRQWEIAPRSAIYFDPGPPEGY